MNQQAESLVNRERDAALALWFLLVRALRLHGSRHLSGCLSKARLVTFHHLLDLFPTEPTRLQILPLVGEVLLILHAHLRFHFFIRQHRRWRYLFTCELHRESSTLLLAQLYIS